jgi:hypothetical protein
MSVAQDMDPAGGDNQASFVAMGDREVEERGQVVEVIALQTDSIDWD